MSPHTLLLSLVAAELLLFFSLANCDPLGFRLALNHVDSKSGLTPSERTERAVHRSLNRRNLIQRRLTGADVSFSSPVYWIDTADYLIEFSIGTPAVKIEAVLDTGSDLIWTQCGSSCLVCLAQADGIYSPTNSTTYSYLPCSNPLCQAPIYSSCLPGNVCLYGYSYGDTSTTFGAMSKETFTFGSTSVSGIAFGCGFVNNGTLSNSSGIVGLGGGPLSLVSQLEASRFSYCLSSQSSDESQGHLFFGSLATVNRSAKSTPFVVNYTSFYYVSLMGISVGEKSLPIPNTTFQLNADGSGGLIIDSGTTFSALAQTGFDILSQEMVTLLNLPSFGTTLFEVCFNITSGILPSLPDLVFHFDGADLTLSSDYYMVWLYSNVSCLAINSVPDGSLSIWGNYQQQNLLILYDVEKRMLSFVPEQCDQL